MKIFRLDSLYFRLPDDFKGSFYDAMEEIVKYGKEKGLSFSPDDSRIADRKEMEKLTHDEYDRLVWKEFINGIGSKKLFMSGNLLEKVDGGWVEIK